MTRFTSVLCGVLTALLLCASVPGAVSAAPTGTQQVPLPRDDPFYVPPAGFESSPNGTVLRSRQVTAVAFVLPVPASTYQVLYKSVDSHDRPVAEAATVLVPKGAWRGQGPRPLLSYQIAVDSLSTRCQPSYTLRAGLFGSPTGVGTYEFTLSLGALLKGYAVVYSDYQGPRSEFAAGPQAAHAVLDGIRAVQHYAPAGLDPQGPVGLWGYSGGGLATTWAAEQQASYAPELNVVGAAAGGVPADLEAMLKYNDGGLGAGLGLLGVMGLDRAFPEAGVQALLNDRGRKLFADNAEACTLDVALFHPFDRLANYTTVAKPADSAPARYLYRVNNTGKATPDFPVYNYHGTVDEFVPLAPVDTLVAGYCADGGTVAVSRIPLAGHITGEIVGAGDALGFLTDTFNGKPTRNDCAKQFR
ncbi:lipase family protein [Amycolatopsis aidingensis]|uniref:lipase family protein n=1 Tax=Amycolatopsis aidingensis TaxID=2842453 RepID=UPI001C0BED19|nr:lipase family protein [Amycolatopsis aidingensis]